MLKSDGKTKQAKKKKKKKRTFVQQKQEHQQKQKRQKQNHWIDALCVHMQLDKLKSYPEESIIICCYPGDFHPEFS